MYLILLNINIFVAFFYIYEHPLFQLCKKHHFGIDRPEKLAQSPDEKFLMKTFSQIKSNVAVPIKKKVFCVILCHPQTIVLSLFCTLKFSFCFLCFVM